MAYDIYGLAKGHCEVHPFVAESYPCSLCYAESEQKRQSDREQKQMYDKMEAEHYAEMERAYYEEIAIRNSKFYRFLSFIILRVDRLNDRLKKYKEKQFINVIRKCPL